MAVRPVAAPSPAPDPADDVRAAADAVAAASAAAVTGAAALMTASQALTTRAERRRARRMADVVADPVSRALTFALTDEVLRVEARSRAARAFADIVDEIGVPRSFGPIDRWSLAVGARLAPRLPWPVVDLLRRRILREAAGVVLPAEDPAFAAHLARRREEGARVNVNVLGEAILSDAEAAERLAMIRARIARPDVDYVSLKVSAVCANLDVLAFEHSVERIAATLRTVYRDAVRSTPHTFVNLDMEEYRDLELTITAMQRVLDEDELLGIDAGIVLQAYLPDAHDAAERLCAWAHRRRARGGGTLKVRVVKGANLAMERVEAELHGWEQAPYPTKHEVDASYKRLVERLLDHRWSDSVRVGVASHNLFDLAWALGLRSVPADAARIDIEMLEGMAPAQSRAVLAMAGDLLLYAPVVRRDDLPASIAYLSRRLDENTSRENFLRALFTLHVGSLEWEEQRRRFADALADRHAVTTTPRRRQDRPVPVLAASGDAPFRNAADTDWTVAANRRWIEAALRERTAAPAPHVTVDVDTVAAVDALVARALAAGATWRSVPFAARREVLAEVAATMERERADTLTLMAAETGKTIGEGDPEVSEAVDFARYYGACTVAIEARIARGHRFDPVGVVVVASPWNFPYAIPAGGVLGALAAGNAVVLKPAPEARATARLLVEQLWRAGVPRDVVQFAACPDDQVGRRLVTHEDVGAVLLTGSFETAAAFLEWKPSMRLMAETSGKNAIVITGAADEDAAIRDLVRSAFGHAGQKCSAASLAIVDAALYDDPRFARRLAAAVESIRVGLATEPATMMGPLIGRPSPVLRRALTTLEPGESWLVEPRCVSGDTLWTPGVRWGVRPGSWFHRTECFGPVLGVMRATDLDDAIRLQNDVDYGLTGGIHSLDESEVRHWLARVEVGNAYVNRHITGAVVQRQPFGGWKRSSVGLGAKAGGPWYVEGLGAWSLGAGPPDDARAFERLWREQFLVGRDATGLRSERNELRHRPLRRVGLLEGAGATAAAFDVLRTAARIAGVEVVPWTAAVRDVDRVRAVGSIDDPARRSVRAAGLDLDESPPLAIAEVELRRWVREQSVSWTRHRHGRLLDDR